MYPWVDDTRNFIGGKCPHGCTYCYVPKLPWSTVKKRYSGKPYLIEKEFKKSLGKGKTIFIQDCGDLFANVIPSEWIIRVFEHCKKFDNTYLFQTKNPERFHEFIHEFPEKIILGTTIETNRNYDVSKAPRRKLRMFDMKNLPEGIRKMVSIEPIMRFDLDLFVRWMRMISPEFISIGADSKNNGLVEPSKEKLIALMTKLMEFTIVKPKSNLKRLIGKHYPSDFKDKLEMID